MIKLPAIFSDGMVLSKEARVWGWAEPGTQIIVKFICRQYEAVTGPDGRFQVTIISQEYGGPHNLIIGDKTIKDVHIGKVWLCGGQSNMEQPLSRARPLLDPHIRDNPNIRAFHAEKGMRFDGPSQDVKGCWQTATGEFLNSTFAVPYFFAEALPFHQTPIGLINVAAGGTPIEAWLPEEIIHTFPDLAARLAPYKQPGFVQNQEQSESTRVQEWHQTLQAKDIGLVEDWHLPNYNHRHWEDKMLLDTNALDYGVVWYRKDITLPHDIDGPISLNLGCVVNSVKVYVNGELVATVDYQYPPCRCILPEGLLKPGINVMALRVVGSSSKPYFVPGKRHELTHKNGSISLKGPWKSRQACAMPRLEPAKWLYNIPTCTYNYMLAPVLGYDVDGMIWYQGESNTGDPQDYKAMFCAFVRHLRKHYKYDLPVISTQLANYVSPSDTGEGWALVRDQQRQCLEIPNTAMAVAIDCGEWNDLHPQDKKTVGQRLALWARRLAYSEDIASSGPAAKAAEICNGTLSISFDYGEGLWAKNGRPMVEVLDSKGMPHHFYAKIEDETLTAQVGGVDAKQVRFGWTDCPAVVLYNAYDLPASPFSISI